MEEEGLVAGEKILLPLELNWPLERIRSVVYLMGVKILLAFAFVTNVGLFSSIMVWLGRNLLGLIGCGEIAGYFILLIELYEMFTGRFLFHLALILLIFRITR